MRNSKLLKSILIPTLGFSAIGSIVAISTSCSCGSDKQDKPYVAINANADSTLTLNNNGENNPDLQYSTDGKNWSPYSTSINITQGQSLYLKGNNPTGWSHSETIYSSLYFIGDVSISGNVMGLLDNGKGETKAIPCDYCFCDLLHNSTGITSVSKNFLPATTLADSCYEFMFSRCTSLTTAPELPATTLERQCYTYMFDSCSSLTTAPILPATSLVNWCYYGMFNVCSSLTTAPELPATTLADSCYGWMFSNCSSLNSIKIGYAGNYSSAYFGEWVNGVASFGTFYYNGSQTAQDFQLLSGWTTLPF